MRTLRFDETSYLTGPPKLSKTAGLRRKAAHPASFDETEEIMKADIHPNYVTATVTCACGTVFETRSTLGDSKIDVCNTCHPFYTGKQKRAAAKGAVEKFNKRYKRKSS